MYFVMYDRHLKSIGETYLLESWSRVQRATDFDSTSIQGQQIPYSAEPFIVVVNNQQGHLLFSGLASTPVIDDKSKKTSIQIKDYRTLFNTDIIWDWSKVTSTDSLADYLSKVFNEWKSQTDTGIDFSVELDVTNLSDINLDLAVTLPSGVESLQAYSLVSDAINYYDLFCRADLNIHRKTLTFVLGKASVNPVQIRLKDFGIPVLEKSFGDFTRATVYSSSMQEIQKWAITTDNHIVKLPSDKALVFPGKNRNFIASESTQDSEYNAVYDAVMALSENRFQENIDIDAQQYRSIIDLTQMGFDNIASVYTEEGFYKNLPVGEIETDSNGKHIIRLGHRIQELTQEL